MMVTIFEPHVFRTYIARLTRVALRDVHVRTSVPTGATPRGAGEREGGAEWAASSAGRPCVDGGASVGGTGGIRGTGDVCGGVIRTVECRSCLLAPHTWLRAS